MTFCICIHCLPRLVSTMCQVVHDMPTATYHISSNRSRALNTSRASNTGQGSDVIVLIEAGP